MIKTVRPAAPYRCLSGIFFVALGQSAISAAQMAIVPHLFITSTAVDLRSMDQKSRISQIVLPPLTVIQHVRVVRNVLVKYAREQCARTKEEK